MADMFVKPAPQNSGIAVDEWFEASKANTKAAFMAAAETHLILGKMEIEAVKSADAYHRAAILFKSAIKAKKK